MDGPRRAGIIAIGVLVTAAVLGLSRWATAPTFVPLYSDLPMEMVGTVQDKLSEAGIDFRPERAGTTIMVAEADVVAARVALAREPLPGAGRPGLELFDKPTWGMTDFTQKVNYRRALEGELERSIGAMTGVTRVKVHLALEDDKLFKADTRESKASVTLAMASGEAPTAATVRGIASLVAGSVSGLESEHVVVVDERGNALTTSDDASGVGLSSRQLTMQREVEQHLEQKAEKLVSSIVGFGNARVQVAAAINFDKIERTTESVNPDEQVISEEHKSEILPQEGQAGAASTSSATSFESSRSVESYSGAIGNVKKLTVAVLVADKVTLTPAVDSLSQPEAVVTARTPEDLALIDALVRTAVGVDTARGDVVSVLSAPFNMPVFEPAVIDSLPAPDMVTKVLTNPKPVVAVAALIVLLILALVMLKALKPTPLPPEQSTAALAAGQAGSSQGGLAPALASGATQGAMAPGAPNGPPSLVPTAPGAANAPAAPGAPEDQRKQVVLPPPSTTEEREQALAMVEQRPEAAVRVTRNWLHS